VIIRKRNNHRSQRRGVTAVEMAIVLPVFLAMVLGMLDLGLAVMRYNSLSQAARRVAREAIVRGSMAEPLGIWGPDSYSGTADDDHPLAQSVRRTMVGVDYSEVAIEATWPEGGNDVQQQVTISVSVPYRPMMTFIFGNPEFTLTATSTMRIAH
jgi:hypothetical protein